MTQSAPRLVVGTLVVLCLFGSGVPAEGTLSARWSSEVLFGPVANSLLGIDSALWVGFPLGGLTATSESAVHVPGGFVWQELGVGGRLGGVKLEGSLLLGPLTASFVYGEVILSATLPGVALEFHSARLSDAVLGGPSAGSALRLAWSTGGADVVSTSEFGARIADDDFPGITIVHASTGLARVFTTDPIVSVPRTAACCLGGLTGEKVTVTGWTLGCLEDGRAMLYLAQTDQDYLDVKLDGLHAGISWLVFSVDLLLRPQRL